MIAIGDIHGCVDELKNLVQQLDPDDHHIFIGDYIDRGPDSKGVIDYLLNLSVKRKCTFLRGNHEEMLLDAIKCVEVNGRDEVEMWLYNGGEATMRSYGKRGRSNLGSFLPEDHLEFICSTKYIHEEDDFVFVHGGFDADEELAPQIADESNHWSLLWQRDHLHRRDYQNWDRVVVCGHTIQPVPMNKLRVICIDTGAFLSYFGGRREGRLTAVVLPERKFISVGKDE